VKQNLNIVVGLAGGTAAPHRIIVAVEDDGLGSSINSFATHSATLQGHSGAAGAAAVGAAFYFKTPRCGTTPATLESFSSEGGAPILFDTSGNALASPIVRQKPDFVGPDGGNDTFLGFTLVAAGITGSDGLLDTSISECQNDPSYPNFFGTSAATPHAAGIAALLLQANAEDTPTQIYAALRDSALPMSGATPNFSSGYGFVQADAALALLAFGPPTLTLAASSVAVGSSTTISWTSVDATSCTASGSWTGPLATSGSQTISPTAVGTSTFTLTCLDATGTSKESTVTLTATAAPASSGGGGELGSLMLFGLAALTLVRFTRARVAVNGARRRR
jgi:subtilisin family serine protease